MLQNESQCSNALKGEMESKHGKILALKEKLQGAKTALEGKLTPDSTMY